MGLSDFLRIARRRWLIIVTAAVLGAGLAAAYTSTITPTYVASSRIYVTMATGTSVNDSYQGGLAAQQRVTSYVNLVTSASVAQRVIDDLSLSMPAAELQSKITATFLPGTALIDVSVTDEDPERAKLLTDKVVAHFRRLVDELETTETGAAPAARVTVVDLAQTPADPIGPNPTRNIAVGLLAGLLLGCLAALARDRLDRTLRTSNDLDNLLPVPTLAIIDIGEPGAEGETRRLRARLTQSNGDADGMSLLVTSFSAESEPEVAISLSESLADTGRRVVLIDADTTGHGSSEQLPVLSSLGLAELLRSTTSPLGALCAWPEAGISVLRLGDADAHTSDLLASDRFADIVSELRTRFDYVVIEAAPVAAAADALAVSQVCDGTVAVVELGRTASPQVSGALATFEQGGSRLLGAVAVSRKYGNWFQRRTRRLGRHISHHPAPDDHDDTQELVLEPPGDRPDHHGRFEFAARNGRRRAEEPHPVDQSR